MKASLPKQTMGMSAEALAKAYLLERGHQLCEQNFRSPWGEIDLITQQGGFIVFVEVRSLTGKTQRPEESITFPKQQRIVKTAAYYLAKHPSTFETRFDVVSITWQLPHPPTITHFPDAFFPPF